MLGAVLGMVLASVLVLVSGAVTGAAEPVQQSLLGSRLANVVPKLHVAMESVGVPLPKLVQLPTDYRDEMAGARHGLQFLRINAVRLNGATCIHCRTPVVFEGTGSPRHAHVTALPLPEMRPHQRRLPDVRGVPHDLPDLPDEAGGRGRGVRLRGVDERLWTVPHGVCPVCGKEYRGRGPGVRR